MTTSIARRGRPASLYEHALLSAAQCGDARAEEELVRRYEPLVRHIVWTLQPLPCRCERADIAQEARLGLLGAIRAWQPTRGRFRPFAAHCIRTKTANALSTARAHKHQLLSQALSLDCALVPLPARKVSAVPLEALLSASNADPVNTVLVRERLAGVCTAWPTVLTAMERAATAGVLSGKSYQQLAVELDCTVNSVRHTLHRARRKLAAQEALVV